MTGIKKILGLVREIYCILDDKDKKRAYLILADILLASVLETAGVGMIIPLITAIATPDQLKSNAIIANLMSQFGITTNHQLILFIGISLALFYVLKNLFLVFSSYIQNSFRYNMQTKLSVRMLKAYLSHPYQFFVDTNSAVIMRGIGGDVGSVKDALEVIFNTLTQTLTLIMIAAFLIYTDWLMALMFLSLSLVCIWLLIYGLKRRVSFLGKEQRTREEDTTRYSRELLDGIKEIFASRKQEVFLDTYNNAFSAKSKVNIAYFTILDIPNRLIETSFIIGIVAIILVRSSMGVDMSMFVPRLAAFALAGIKILPSMSVISKSMTQLIFQKPGVDEAYSNIIKYENVGSWDIKDNPEKEPFVSLELKNVRWKYNGSDEEVLNGIDLKVKAGESVGIIGGSGSGKTTLIDLILGLYIPQSGEITVNGVRVNEFQGNWNQLVSYVQQNVFLLDDTIRKNIAFGEADSDIDDERVWKALKAAQIDDFVRESGKGLDTIVGEKGVRFSGGQRQRVAIARALYFDSDIIIFDEATAALDNETEAAVMDAINTLRGEKTLIIVAHRLSTIKKCDRVYEVKDGQLTLKDKENIKA